MILLTIMMIFCISFLNNDTSKSKINVDNDSMDDNKNNNDNNNDNYNDSNNNDITNSSPDTGLNINYDIEI